MQGARLALGRRRESTITEERKPVEPGRFHLWVGAGIGALGCRRVSLRVLAQLKRIPEIGVQYVNPVGLKTRASRLGCRVR